MTSSAVAMVPQSSMKIFLNPLWTLPPAGHSQATMSKLDSQLDRRPVVPRNTSAAKAPSPASTDSISGALSGGPAEKSPLNQTNTFQKVISRCVAQCVNPFRCVFSIDQPAKFGQPPGIDRGVPVGVRLKSNGVIRREKIIGCPRSEYCLPSVVVSHRSGYLLLLLSLVPQIMPVSLTAVLII
jgi:hypothetical protein